MKSFFLIFLSLSFLSIITTISYFVFRPKILPSNSPSSITDQISAGLPSNYSLISLSPPSFRQVQILIQGPSSKIQVILDPNNLPLQIQILQKLLEQPKIESVTFLNLASKPPYGHRQDN